MKGKFTMSLSKTMLEALENERKLRKLRSLQETIRFILAEYFREKNE